MDSIIESIDVEIARLQRAKSALSAMQTKRSPGRPRNVPTEVKPKLGKRKMSAAGRARIAAAQKARWAKLRTKDKPTATKKVAPAAKKSPTKG
jgi:hypothetical protein